eukprot:159644_1
MAEDDKWCNRLKIVLFLAFIGGMIYMIVEGVNVSNSGDEYAENSTKENCYLFDYETSTCYCGNKGGCPSQAVYSYHAYAFDKCGNATLYSEYDECSEDPFDLDEEKSCYVLDCFQQKFTVKQPEDVSSDGSTYIAIGVIFLILGIGAFIAWMYYLEQKQKNTTQHNY